MLLFLAARRCSSVQLHCPGTRAGGICAATSSLGKERLAYQMISRPVTWTSGGSGLGRCCRRTARLMDRNERLLSSLANSEEGIGTAAANQPAALTQLEQARNYGGMKSSPLWKALWPAHAQPRRAGRAGSGDQSVCGASGRIDQPHRTGRSHPAPALPIAAVRFFGSRPAGAPSGAEGRARSGPPHARARGAGGKGQRR